MGATAAAFAEWYAASSVAQTAATAVAAQAAGAVANKLTDDKPEMQEVKAPGVMPDPLEQQKARERAIVEQMARRGRGASILTQPGGSQTLGS